MTIIKIKKSHTVGVVPLSLQLGELALNTADGKIFFSDINNNIKSLTGTTYPTLSKDEASAGTSTVPSVITSAVLKSAITTHAASHLPLTGGTMAGNLNMNNFRITNVGTPTSVTDVANKSYVDTGDRTNLPPMVGTSPSERTVPITYSGLILRFNPCVILLGGYVNTLTQHTLSLSPSTTSYIYLEKTLNDRTTINSSYSATLSGENFYRVCVAKVVTNATSVTTLELIKVAGFETEINALRAEIDALK